MRQSLSFAAVSGFLLSLLLVGACAMSGADSETLEPPSQWSPPVHLKDEIRYLMKAHDIPGVSFSIVNSNGEQYAAAYGDARPGVPVTDRTMFNTASVTKFLASELVLQLADDGLFEIDQPMAPVFVDPDVADDPRAQNLTPRHALAHQSGFPNWRFMADDNKLAFEFEPGTRPGYSGEGYNYVARYVSALTESSFIDLLSSHVLEPANARFVGFTPEGVFAQHFAWSRKPDGQFTEADRQDWSAADDLYAAAGDLGRVLSRMLRADSLSPELEHARRTIQFDMAEPFCARPGFGDICPEAVGFTLTGIAFEYTDESVYWQGGGDVGERAVVFMVPERDLGVVILTNSSTGGRVFETIASAFYDNQKFTRFLGLQGAQ